MSVVAIEAWLAGAEEHGAEIPGVCSASPVRAGTVGRGGPVGPPVELDR